MLGGRAIRFEMYGLIRKEIGPDFDLTKILNNGYLPSHYDSALAQELIRSYVSDYLKEEIAAEELVRNLPAFSQFLNIAAISDTENVHYTNIALIAVYPATQSKSITRYCPILSLDDSYLRMQNKLRER